MASFVQEVRALMNPGFSLERRSGNLYHILDAHGEYVRNESGQPIGISATGSWHYKRRALTVLREAGVIPPAHTRSHKPKPPATKEPRSEFNPIIQAKTILGDPQATPRERGMAKAYLRLLEDHQSYVEAAEYVRQRLRELGD